MRLGDIQIKQQGYLKPKNIPWFSEATNHPGLAKGGIYLLSGQPGAGKTTLALQISTDIASMGIKVLYLTLEQSPGELKNKIENQIFSNRANGTYNLKEGLKKVSSNLEIKKEEEKIYDNLYVDANVNKIDTLPDFFARQVLGKDSPYSNISLIIVDSIQGLGTTATSSKPYQGLFEFNRWAKEHNICVLLIGHITKTGRIAGPKSLEHNVDCVLYLRKVMRLRPLFVPKNRFGPERHEPLTLIMNNKGCLVKSKYIKAKAGHSYGYLGMLSGKAGDLIEVQTLVKLPKYGDKPGIKAPYLPKQKLSQIVGIINGIKEIDISDLQFEINCTIPEKKPYKHTLDLPLAMSMISSYFQRQIEIGSLFVGELDLFQTIRPILSRESEDLIKALVADKEDSNPHIIKKIFISKLNETEVVRLLQEKGLAIEVYGVEKLEDIIKIMWKDVN